MKISNLLAIDPKSIANIVLDWGGVITNIDFEAAIKSFEILGYQDFANSVKKYPDNRLMQQFETGEKTSDEIYTYFSESVPGEVTPDDIWKAWNSLLRDTPQENISLIKNLRKKYRLFLLSNTNSIHVNYYKKRLDTQFGIDFFGLFEETYLSFKMGMRKPDRKIFDEVLIQSNLESSETLFIDDSIVNIEAAQKCGYRTLHITDGLTLKKFFTSWLE